MKKIYFLFLTMMALLGVSSASAQVIVSNLPNCDTNGVGYYYVISNYDQLPEGEEWALTLTEDYEVVVKPLDRNSRQQIFRIAATTNNGNPTTDGGSPRYRFYSCDKEDVIHGLQGTENNDMELLHGTTYITSAGTESNVGMCSMRVQGKGHTIAMNNRTGKLIVPQNFTDGAPVYMTGGVMDNANNTCQVWTFEAVSPELLKELDPEAAENFYKDQVISLYTTLANMGSQDEDTGLPYLTGGTLYGFYPVETANLYNETMTHVYERLDYADSDELITLYDQLTALKAKMDEGFIQVTDGYYILLSAYDKLNALGTDPDAIQYEMAAFAGDNGTWWSLDEPNFRDNPLYIWKFEKRDDGLWSISNMQTKKYFDRGNFQGAIAKLDATEKWGVGMIYAGEGRIGLYLGDTGWKLYPRNSGTPFGEKSTDEHQIMSGDNQRGFTNETGKYWYLEFVPEDKIEALLRQAELEAEAFTFAEGLQQQIIDAKNSILPAYVRDISEAEDITPKSVYAYDGRPYQNAQHGQSCWTDEDGNEHSRWDYGLGGGSGTCDAFEALFNYNVANHFIQSYSDIPVYEYVYNDNGDLLDSIPGLPYLEIHLGDYEDSTTPGNGLEGDPNQNKTYHNGKLIQGRKVSNIGFGFFIRDNSTDWGIPHTIDIEVSENGYTWKKVQQANCFWDSETYEAFKEVLVGPYDLGGEYEYVRFHSYGSRQKRANNNFFNLASLKVYTGMKLLDGCQANTIAKTNPEIVQRLSDALGNASVEVKDNTAANMEDMQKASAELAEALEAFKTFFVDPRELQALLPDARTLIQNFSTDENFVGTYTSDAQADYDALKAAVDKYDGIMDGSDSEMLTPELLDELIETIKTSEENMAQKIRMPETDKWYQIYFGSEDEWADLGWDVLEPRNLAGRNDAMVDAEDNIETVWNLYDRKMAICTDYEMSEEFDPEYIKDLRFFSVSEEGLEANDEALSYFRFIPVGENGLYAIQNKATGLYVGPAAGTNGDIVPSVVPGLFSVKNAGPGFVTLRSHNFQDEAEHQNTIHFRRSEYGIVAYTDGVNNQGANTKSALHVKAVNETVSDEVSIFIPAEDTETVMAYALPGGVKKVNSESTLYKVTGKFEEDGVTYVALEEVESVEPGAPFLITGEYYAEIVSSDDLAQTPVKENGITGTYAQYTAQNGNLVLDLLTDMYYVEGDDYPHSYWDDLELNLFNQFSVVNAYDMVTNKNINAGGAYIVNIDELPIVEPTEMSVLILQANINSDFLPVGVKSVKADTADADIAAKAVFNMAGQRVGTIADLKSLKKGIYIVNGRKVLVK